jgi:hypothetical protein
MTDFIYIYNTILFDKINFIKNNSKIKKYNSHTCYECNQTFNQKFIFNKFKFTSYQYHLFVNHSKINPILYENLCKINFENFIYSFSLLHSNNINIIDGIYEEGSYNIFINKNKNLFNTEKLNFSEHSGFILFNADKVDKVVVLNNYRTDKDDPTIFLPQNTIEALSVNYIFHTHPKTPEIFSRFINDGILYEFPSLNDIYHFIDHHNRGILNGSLVITPEGIYNIRKKNFNEKKIIIDDDIFDNVMNDIYIECNKQAHEKYHKIKFNENNFYKHIATNLEFIKKINNILEKFDITIDYICRVKSNRINNNYKSKWIIPNFYLPIIN